MHLIGELHGSKGSSYLRTGQLFKIFGRSGAVEERRDVERQRGKREDSSDSATL